MASPTEAWSPYRECVRYTHTNIYLPEGLTIEDVIGLLVQQKVISATVTPVSHDDGIKTWDVQVAGLSQRLISSRPGEITIWSSRDRSGARDMTFEKLVCGIRTEIEGARVQIFI